MRVAAAAAAAVARALSLLRSFPVQHTYFFRSMIKKENEAEKRTAAKTRFR